MLFRDNEGRLLSEEEVDRLAPHEILDRGIHLART